jgi:hypothetical protein
MLQLNVSSTTNSSAVYPDVTASLGTTQVLLEFTQSYDFSTKGDVIATLINTVGPTNPWLVFQVSGSTLPTASGQYNVNIWEFANVGTGSVIWSAATSSWSDISLKWGGTGVITKTNLLSTDRAFISGSNSQPTTTYLLPANGGKYTTYNYP